MKRFAILSLACGHGTHGQRCLCAARVWIEDPGAKYNFYGNSGGTAMRSANEYSASYREYVPTAEKVNPEVAKEASDSIGTYITKAQKHFAHSSTQAANVANDADTLTAAVQSTSIWRQRRSHTPT